MNRGADALPSTTPPPSLSPAAEGGRATDAAVSPFVRPDGNGNFEYINGKGTDKSRTESWEKLKAGDAGVGPALRTPGEAELRIAFLHMSRTDLKGGVLPSALAFRLESAPFSARFLGHEGATLHGQTSAAALLTTTLNTRDG